MENLTKMSDAELVEHLCGCCIEYGAYDRKAALEESAAAKTELEKRLLWYAEKVNNA